MKLNQQQREFALHLLKGKYAMLRMSNEGLSVYMVYENNQVPVKYYSKDHCDLFEDFFKKDKLHRLTFNLSLIRKVDGRNYLKKMYKAIN